MSRRTEVVVVTGDPHGSASGMLGALESPDASTRLRAAMMMGTRPERHHPHLLVARCRIEPDFFVRDMLTWALTRQDRESTLPLVAAELGSELPQARSQALHTLSKFADRRVWSLVTTDLLTDPDDEVARAAWRAAVGLAEHEEQGALAAVLASQLGRGDRDVQRSLSRAFVVLGAEGSAAVAQAAVEGNDLVRAHARATEHLMSDPDAGFEAAFAEAQRHLAFHATPAPEE